LNLGELVSGGLAYETKVNPEGTGSRFTVKVTGGKRFLYEALAFKRSAADRFLTMLENAVKAK
jgi:hypothetical protein